MGEPVRIFVGADRSQLLAIKVLEHSIKRHTQLPVEVHPMVDLPVRVPENPLNWQRTGFSFSRFCIPELAGYQGRAIYMDADMLVFTDIADLWTIPFEGAKVIIQEDLPEDLPQGDEKPGAPKQRIKQCAVMLLDCDRIAWKVEHIIDGLDRGDYSYEKLMYELCILEDSEIRYAVPFEWNSMEHYQRGKTSLIHYTDMSTQPWVNTQNQNGDLWLNEVRLMIETGALTPAELQQEIDLGYFRPSLMIDLRFGHRVPPALKKAFNAAISWLDKTYLPHQEVRQLKRMRVRATKAANKKAANKKPDTLTTVTNG
ncbi:MAG: glycosyltransferase [Cyanobacteria bacterium J06635_11]